MKKDSRSVPELTVGFDLGDKYSYVFVVSANRYSPEMGRSRRPPGVAHRPFAPHPAPCSTRRQQIRQGPTRATIASLASPSSCPDLPRYYRGSGRSVRICWTRAVFEPEGAKSSGLALPVSTESQRALEGFLGRRPLPKSRRADVKSGQRRRFWELPARPALRLSTTSAKL